MEEQNQGFVWWPWLVSISALAFFYNKAQADSGEPQQEPVLPKIIDKLVNGKNAAGEAPKGQLDVPVLELQNIMLGLGWPREKMTADGDYGPKTVSAWKWVTNSKDLDQSIARVNGQTARVNSHSYVSLRTQFNNKVSSKMTPAARSEYLFPIG
jgi:hypothetical protein